MKNKETALELVGVSEAELVEQQQEWKKMVIKIQEQVTQLSGQIDQLQRESFTLNGAILACDIFLQRLKSPK